MGKASDAATLTIFFLYLSNLCNKLSNTKFEGETTVLCALEVLPLWEKTKGYQLKVIHFLTNLSTLKNDNTNSLQQKHLRRNYLKIRLGLNFIFTFFPVHFSKKM